MKFNYSKLKGRIIEKFGKQENFAKAFGVSTATISNKLNNKTYWDNPEIAKVIELLEISPDEINDYFFNYEVQELEPDN